MALDVQPIRMLDDDAEMNGLRAGDGKQIVTFYTRSVANKVKSVEMGRPVYDPVVYMKLQHPGDKLFVLDQPATRDNMDRFPAAWKRYREGKTEMESGTPLAMMFPGNPEIVDNLSHLGLYTVEHLAAVSDGEVGNLGPSGRKWVEAARKTMNQAEANAETIQLREQNARMEQQMAAMQQQLSEIMAAQAKPEAPAPHRKGA